MVALRKKAPADPPAASKGTGGTDEPPDWPAEWLRGALEVCVLAAMAPGPTYGYAIGSALEEAGLGQVKGGTLYPLLGRLEAAGLVVVEWRAGESGPGRKYYALNDAGRAELGRRRTQWHQFTDVTRRLIGEAGS